MRLDVPRVPALRDDQLDAETRERFGGRVLNIFRTLAHHPKLLKRWLVFGNHVLSKSSLSPRDRELVILRVGWLCQSGYEWGQHVVIGKQAGISDDEIARIADGPDAPNWTPLEALLLRAADELHVDSFIGDNTWNSLSEHFDTEQLIDLVFTVGQYHLVSMALNTFGVQLDAGLTGLPSQ
jgi:4-carboxymuconolactone decarboxylase